jgi:hypothetical protein
MTAVQTQGELGECVSRSESCARIPSQAGGHPPEGVETTGGKMGSLNNQHERPAPVAMRGDEIVHRDKLWFVEDTVEVAQAPRAVIPFNL